MRVELFHPRAEIIQARFSGLSPHQPILGAFTPAELQVGALTAILGKLVTLIKPETFLPVRIRHGAPMRIADIADPIRGIDKVVTGEHVAVMFDHHALAAELRGNTALRRQA